ncbi:MAG: hypothetical protein ACOY4O_10325 [Pseudomonadota bacterium]
MLVLVLAPGCVISKTRLLDDKDGIADPYFTGRFTLTLGKTEALRVFLKGNRYLIEDERGVLWSFASLHRLQDDVLLLQKWNVRGVATEHYEYFLVRKTPSGFDASHEALCDGKPDTCKAETRDDLRRVIERQLPVFLADATKRVELRRQQ